MSPRCSKCSINLFDRPEIRISKASYCFRCSKQAYQAWLTALQQQANDRFRLREQAYRELEAGFPSAKAAWLELRCSANLPTLEASWGCALSSAVLGGGILYGLNPAVGLFAGVTIFTFVFRWSENHREKAVAEFMKRYPEPIMPFFSTAPDSVEVEMECPTRRCLDVPTDYDRVRDFVRKRDELTCQACGERKSVRDVEVHHVIPKVKGGHDDPTNLVVLCKYCHDRETWFGHVRKNPTTL